MAEDLRYPIGRFAVRPEIDEAGRTTLIDHIAALPANLRDAVFDLDDAQLDTPYRPGGWTVRQVVHHLPDSHMNSFTRFKIALTEEDPTIRPYDQDAFAKLPDAAGAVGVSLALLDALHERWVGLLRSIEDHQWARTFQHPEVGTLTLDANLQLYAWHGRHHLAHVTRLRERMGW